MIGSNSYVSPEMRLDKANRVHRKYRNQLEAQTGVVRTSVGFDGQNAWISVYATAYASVSGELDGVELRVFRVAVPMPPGGF